MKKNVYKKRGHNNVVFMRTIVIIIQSHPIYLYQVYNDVCLFANFMTD